jgi:hypothetical protein
LKELENTKAEMEAFRLELERKEKEIRMQVVQVKQLRRSLKEMALGGIHFITPALANGPPLHSKESGDIIGPALDIKEKKRGEEKQGPQAVINPVLARLLLKVDVKNSKKKKIPNGLAMKEGGRGGAKEEKLLHVLEVELDFCQKLADLTAHLKSPTLTDAAQEATVESTAISQSSTAPDNTGDTQLSGRPAAQISTANSAAQISTANSDDDVAKSGEDGDLPENPTLTELSSSLEERRQPTPPIHGKRSSRPHSKSNPRPSNLSPAPAPALQPEMSAEPNPMSGSVPTSTPAVEPLQNLTPSSPPRNAHVSVPQQHVSAPEAAQVSPTPGVEPTPELHADPAPVVTPEAQAQTMPTPIPVQKTFNASAPVREAYPIPIPTPAPAPAPAPKGNTFSMGGGGKKKTKKDYFAKPDTTSSVPTAPASVNLPVSATKQPVVPHQRDTMGSTYNNDNVDMTSFVVAKSLPGSAPASALPPADEVVDDVVEEDTGIDNLEDIQEVGASSSPMAKTVSGKSSKREVKENPVSKQPKSSTIALVEDDGIVEDLVDTDTLEEVKEYNQAATLGNRSNAGNSVTAMGRNDDQARVNLRQTRINSNPPGKQSNEKNDVSLFGDKSKGSSLGKSPVLAPAPAPIDDDDDDDNANYDDDFMDDSLDATEIE